MIASRHARSNWLSANALRRYPCRGLSRRLVTPKAHRAPPEWPSRWWRWNTARFPRRSTWRSPTPTATSITCQMQAAKYLSNMRSATAWDSVLKTQPWYCVRSHERDCFESCNVLLRPQGRSPSHQVIDGEQDDRADHRHDEPG